MTNQYRQDRADSFIEEAKDRCRNAGAKYWESLKQVFLEFDEEQPKKRKAKNVQD